MRTRFAWLGLAICALLFLMEGVAENLSPSAEAAGMPQLSAGRFHTCAIVGGGVQCWGRNGNGQLGNGTTSNSMTPVPVAGLSSDVTQVAAGGIHTCALTTAETVKCWGNNNNGQLGDGTATQSTTPVNVSGLSGVAHIAAGNGHTCAVTTAGEVFCWGSNTVGQLGDGTTAPHNTPATVPLFTQAADITAGQGHSCALLVDGAVMCWGSNTSGQVGVVVDPQEDPETCLEGAPICSLPEYVCEDASCGTTGNSLGGVAIRDVPTLAAGGDHTCARTIERRVRCWGKNDKGQLGDGSTTNRYYAVQVPGLEGAISVSAGIAHSCAFRAGGPNGQLQCWGDNAFGQLGDGTTTQHNAPTDVQGVGSAIDAVAVGGRHTCGRTDADALKCWGYNQDGQLGNASSDSCAGTPCGKSPLDVSTLTPKGLPSNPDAKFRALAEHWAPVIYQDTAAQKAHADYITNFDFDGNWRGTDNWENQPDYSLFAHTYYWVVETSSNWFIGYGLFHPRDWQATCTDPPGPLPSDCHENDMEGVLLTIKKDGSTFGQFLLMATQAHGDFLWFKDTDNSPSNLIDGPFRDCEDSQECDVEFEFDHPKVFIEAKGHGVYGACDEEGDLNPFTPNKGWSQCPEFPGGDGIIYRHTDTLEVPVNGNDRTAGYALTNIQDLWSRRCEPEPFFDFSKFRGDTPGANSASPPWGWADYLGTPSPEFFLRPAGQISASFTGLGSFEFLTYLGASFNPPGPYDNLPSIKCDSDEDGIRDRIDKATSTYSDEFSDRFSDVGLGGGGTTFGRITNGAGLAIDVHDEPNPEGVRAKNNSSGGGSAEVTFCTSPETKVRFVQPEKEVTIKCSSATVGVLSGPVDVEFGSLSANLASGTTTTVDEPSPGTFDVTNSTVSGGPVILVGGLGLAPGASFLGLLDTDTDGLVDQVETDTGAFVSPSDTGTDPNNPDTDGDGVLDGHEVIFYSTDPLVSDIDGGNRVTSPDTTGDVGRYSSLVLDAQGNPVVTYYDAINEDLKVLHCSDQNCAPLGDSITSPDSVGSQGYTSSVALDAAGNPVVSYYGDGPSDGHLKVLHCDDPNCSSGGEIITVPDTAQDVGYNSSIVLDASGNPVISYYANIGQDLKLLHCDDPDCAPGGDSITSPDTGDGVGQYTSLKLDSSGNPVVSYWDFINNDLKVLHCDDPACAPGGDSITTPDAGVVGYTGSLMLDGEGNPVISYNGNGEIKLLHCDDPYCAPGGNSFTTPGLGFNSSMVLDAAGNPVLRYSDGEDLKVMHCDDPGCASGGDSVTAPANDNGGYLGSFALDGYGNPVASYYGAGLDLKILHCDNPACGGGQATTPTGTSVAVGLGTDVTVTFGQVTSPGMTVANLETVPAAPGGFTFGSPPAQYQIATTAAYTGSIQVCIDYYDESFAPEMEAGLLLMHYEAGNWLDVTTSLDTVNNFICGESNSLSPFGVMSLATGQDYDTDGCSNAAELGQNQLTGGLRDPLNPNDYFNPSHDGKNRVDDILLTVQAYFDDDNDGTPGLPPYAAGYNPDTDRTLVGPSAWNLGPPNGLQRVDDILNQVKQYFHDCS